MTATTTEQAAWTHAARMAATICETDWSTVLERLPLLDGYLLDQLITAANQLRAADTAAAEAIANYRAAQDRFGALLETQTHQLSVAEEALAVCGYLHPSRVHLLGETAEEAIADRHDARGALADLLFCARTVLDDAA